MTRHYGIVLEPGPRGVPDARLHVELPTLRWGGVPLKPPPPLDLSRPELAPIMDRYAPMRPSRLR